MHRDEENRRGIDQKVPSELVAGCMKDKGHCQAQKEKQGARAEGPREDEEQRSEGFDTSQEREVRIRPVARVQCPIKRLDTSDEECDAERPPQKDEGSQQTARRHVSSQQGSETWPAVGG